MDLPLFFVRLDLTLARRFMTGVPKSGDMVTIAGKSGVHVVTNVSPSQTEVCIEGTDFEWFRVQVSTLVASPPPPPATLGKGKAASRAA